MHDVNELNMNVLAGSRRRLGMTNHAFDGRKAQPQGALDVVDLSCKSVTLTEASTWQGQVPDLPLLQPDRGLLRQDVGIERHRSVAIGQWRAVTAIGT
jgi:hypothetical protein